MGHTDNPCFQPGGKMEGCREEYLASWPTQAQAHLASAEKVEQTDLTDDSVLMTEFAAMSFSPTNDMIMNPILCSYNPL
jgi:hypothetical protein